MDQIGRRKKGNFDVALACADSGLVVNDLLVILCQWDTQQNSKAVEEC